MKKSSLLIGALLLSTTAFADNNGIFTSNCEHSTITIVNDTDDQFEVTKVNESFTLAKRTRGKILNMQKGQTIPPHSEHTAHLASGFASNGSIWGAFSLENENNQKTTINFDFTTPGFNAECKANLAISTQNPHYQFSYSAPNDIPVDAKIYLSSK